MMIPKKRKRKNPWLSERINPWVRHRDAKLIHFVDPDKLNYLKNYSQERPQFTSHQENLHLDIDTKIIALHCASWLVSLVSYPGEEEIFQSSGSIIESNDDNSAVVLTSASLLRSLVDQNIMAHDIKDVAYLSNGKKCNGEVVAHDFHFNLAAIRIQSDYPLPTARLIDLDDSAVINPRHLHTSQEKSFQLRPHSTSYHLLPGANLIALARYSISPHNLMASPGEFRLDICEYDCKELFRVACKITRSGDGGPLVNRHGEVVGINFYDPCLTAFMPINIVRKWWEHFKLFGKLRRPWLGMAMTNLYNADLRILERFIQKFPGVSKGVIVDGVMRGSTAETAGIRSNDVITECDGKTVEGFLELFEMMWNKVGDSVELGVVRGFDGSSAHVRLAVVEATPDNFYRWPQRKTG